MLFAIGFVMFFGGLFFGLSLPVKSGLQPLEALSLVIVVAGATCLVVDSILARRRFQKATEWFLGEKEK